MRVGELAIPLIERMRNHLLQQDYLQADETTVAVQMRDGRGADHDAYLWQYGKPGGETVFDFRMGREREGPLKFLGKWEGILQTDGYQAYDGVGGPKLVHVGCWAHARRKFVDAVKVNPEDGPAMPDGRRAWTRCFRGSGGAPTGTYVSRSVSSSGGNMLCRGCAKSVRCANWRLRRRCRRAHSAKR